MIVLTMFRPRPVPRTLVVKNGSKACSRVSGGIPGPVSEKLMTTLSSLRLVEINGVWEDHVRYGMTSEEWLERRTDLVAEWISGVST